MGVCAHGTIFVGRSLHILARDWILNDRQDATFVHLEEVTSLHKFIAFGVPIIVSHRMGMLRLHLYLTLWVYKAGRYEISFSCDEVQHSVERLNMYV
jgi:hypothetical protein